jgi:hypothetical protein
MFCATGRGIGHYTNDSRWNAAIVFHAVKPTKINYKSRQHPRLIKFTAPPISLFRDIQIPSPLL